MPKVTVARDNDAAVADLLRDMARGPAPEIPLAKFARNHAPMIARMTADGWTLSTIYDGLKGKLPGISYAMFQRHVAAEVDAYVDEVGGELPAEKRRGRPRGKAKKAPVSEPAPAAAMPLSIPSESVSEPAPAAPAAHVEALRMPAPERPDYSGQTVVLSVICDREPAAGFRRDGDRLVSPPIPGEMVPEAIAELTQKGARDIRVEVVEPDAPRPF